MSLHSVPRVLRVFARSQPTLPRLFLSSRFTTTRFPHPSVLRASFRHASSSTTSETATSARSLVTRLKNLVFGTSLLLFLSFGYLYITDTRASIHRHLVVPILRLTHSDAEDAHHFGTSALKVLYPFNLHPRERGTGDADGDLAVSVYGHRLANPIGTSGGIDKNGEIPSQLLALGPAVVEIGGVTPRPQEGNPKPRVFRLPSQNALINRYGLNSEGAEAVGMRLRQRVRDFAYAMGYGTGEEAERKVLDGEAGVPPGSLVSGRLMAVQVSKNKDTPDRDMEAVKRDYVHCVEVLAPYADIIVVNVSSPNTPGLRALQSVEPLTQILGSVVGAARATKRKTKPAVMVKVSPDEDEEEQISGICEAVWESGVDGVIVGNTTKKRPDPIPRGYVVPAEEADILLEHGGFSGPHLFDRTLELVKRYRKALDVGPRKVEPELEPADATTTSSQPHLPADQKSAIDASIARDSKNLKLLYAASEEKQPLIQFPSSPSESSLLASPMITSSSEEEKPKVIFATGGITNGRQALQILDAGASVAMVYTALVYGGVGTVTRIKEEMRDEKGNGQK
ncbi:FMN-linked oxidoreductase [Aulographum hederae CBS 113979]|uniref:Dihydroorotate dehydrogenase (quinone), mitochondrial n=1 Tax=Aulographum hederae CBS 113979 TaxID=1176131 RepID=A0A6G1H344_9PEZI|nr:FMN-linked oxidoreductase [Aulographum hederae CBS 113979]